MKATLVDKEAEMVTMEDRDISITIVKGKVVASMGFINPAEYKKAMKIYYSIITK